MKKAILLAALLATFSVFASAQKEKITAEEIIQKHLASIGTPEAIAAVKSRVMVGQGNLSSRLGYIGGITGPAQLASDGDKFLLAIVFNSNDYPYEKLAYDGKNMSIGRPRGNVTRLGEFLKSQSSLLKQGLLGGALSSAWPLLNRDPKAVKVEYAGTENIGGKTLHKVKFNPARSDSLRVTLYFDADTYQHVMSEYQYTIQPHMISSDSTVNPTAKASHYSLIERFSDFKKVGDLTLPLQYTIDVASQTAEGAETLRWTIAIKQVFYNEPLEAANFKVS
jgi:hypothetical protein